MRCVDVVVPCYNYGVYLTPCVQSVLQQQDVQVRVLIIDDASADQTAHVAQKLAEQDARVHFRRHDRNQGHISTYNEGLLHWASSEYSLLLSADDMLTPGALSRATRLLDEHPSVGMVYGMAINVFGGPDIDNPQPENNGYSSEYQIIPSKQFLHFCLSEGNPVPTPTAVVRTTVQRAVGGYRAELPHSADMEMWMRFAACGPIGVLRATQAFYRKHGSNMSDQYYQQAVGDRRERAEACKRFLETSGGGVADVKLSSATMYQKLAWDAFWNASRAFDAGDVERCISCLQLAEDFFPKIRVSVAWWRLQAKMLLGCRVWRRIYPYSEFLRIRNASSDSRSIDKSQHKKSSDSMISGWWPVESSR